MHTSMQNSLGNAMHAKRHVATCTIWPCSLGFQKLGLFHTACIGHSSLYGCIALGWVMSHPALFLYGPGEDDSPKPSCSKW